jgi:hypothetical protein
MTRARLRSMILSLGHRFTAARSPTAAICSIRFSPVASSQRSMVCGWSAISAILPHSIRGRQGLYFHYAPPHQQERQRPAKLASRMKRRWRVVLLRAKGEILGDVEAPDAAAAKVAAVARFDLDEVQRTRIIVQEYA